MGECGDRRTSRAVSALRLDADSPMRLRSRPKRAFKHAFTFMSACGDARPWRCTQTGQTAMQASFAPGDADGSAIGGRPPKPCRYPFVYWACRVFSRQRPGFRSPRSSKTFRAISKRRKTRRFPQAVLISATGSGRRGAGRSAFPAAGSNVAPARTDSTGSTSAITNAPPSPMIARAEAASLGAYEFKTAGQPIPEGGLRATNIAYAPAQFELAGVKPNLGGRGSGGGLRWRAAYDNVETDCFPETLRRALDQLAAHFNSEVLVTSGKRDRGRRGSMHRACKAADVRVVGVSPAKWPAWRALFPASMAWAPIVALRSRTSTSGPSVSPGAGDLATSSGRKGTTARQTTRRFPFCSFAHASLADDGQRRAVWLTLSFNLPDARPASRDPCRSGRRQR